MTDALQRLLIWMGISFVFVLVTVDFCRKEPVYGPLAVAAAVALVVVVGLLINRRVRAVITRTLGAWARTNPRAVTITLLVAALIACLGFLALAFR